MSSCLWSCKSLPTLVATEETLPINLRGRRYAIQVRRVVDNAVLMQDASKDESGQQAKQYKQLLDALNDVAHHEIDAWLSREQHLSEPFVARSISEQLPSGAHSTAMS